MRWDRKRASSRATPLSLHVKLLFGNKSKRVKWMRKRQFIFQETYRHQQGERKEPKCTRMPSICLCLHISLTRGTRKFFNEPGWFWWLVAAAALSPFYHSFQSRSAWSAIYWLGSFWSLNHYSQPWLQITLVLRNLSHHQLGLAFNIQALILTDPYLVKDFEFKLCLS